MNFEDELRQALRREPAPPDFRNKVIARTVRTRRPAMYALAAALALAAIVPTAVNEHRRREEAKGREATRELFVALNITRAKLQQTKQRIERATRNPL